MPLILFDGSVGDSRNGRNGSTSSDFLCRKFQFEKMPFKKGFKYFDFFIHGMYFCIFSSVDFSHQSVDFSHQSVDFSHQSVDFSHQSVDFSHQKVPSVLLPQGVSAPQKVTKGYKRY